MAKLNKIQLSYAPHPGSSLRSAPSSFAIVSARLENAVFLPQCEFAINRLPTRRELCKIARACAIILFSIRYT